MKPKTIILTVIAVACGLGASYMTSKLLAKRDPKPVEKVRVVVATKKVPQFRMIKDPKQYFTIKEMPKDLAPRKGFSDLNEIKDRALNKELNPDVPLTQDDILAAGFKPIKIPDGKYAIAINVNAAKNVGNFVYPGDEVDFILTQYRAGATAQTILRKVLILAAGGATTPNTQGKTTIQAKTVTVAVSSEEAQLLRLAEKRGELSLVLRGIDDPNTSPVPPMTEDRLALARTKTEREPNPEQPDPEPKPEVKPETPVEKLPPVEDPPKTEGPKKVVVEHKVLPDWKIEFQSGKTIQDKFFYKREDGKHSIESNPFRIIREERWVKPKPEEKK